MSQIYTDDDGEKELNRELLDEENSTPLRDRKSETPRRNDYRVYLISILVSLSSFLWGYTISIFNVCIVEDAEGSILIDIKMSDSEVELATALVLVGAWMFSLLSGSLSEKYGRRKAILCSNLLFILGTLFCAFALSKTFIYFGRFILGLSCGIVTNVIPVLLTEISPSHIRGQIIALHQLNITIGILASGIMGYILVTQLPSGWRYANGFMLIPVLLQCILYRFLPESPCWLLERNRILEANLLLRYLNPKKTTEEINELIFQLHQQSSNGKPQRSTSWYRLFAYKRELIIGGILVICQAMTGINTVILYSAKIFQMAGVNEPIIATVSVGSVNVMTTILSLFLIDKYGRKILLLVGTILMGIALFALSFSLFFLNESPQLQGRISVFFILMYIAGFAIGLGAVVWVILGETIPSAIRSRAYGLFMTLNYLCNIFIAFSTLSIINALGNGEDPEKNGIAKLYIICGFISWMTVLFIGCFVSETKGILINGTV